MTKPSLSQSTQPAQGLQNVFNKLFKKRIHRFLFFLLVSGAIAFLLDTFPKLNPWFILPVTGVIFWQFTESCLNLVKNRLNQTEIELADRLNELKTVEIKLQQSQAQEKNNAEWQKLAESEEEETNKLKVEKQNLQQKNEELKADIEYWLTELEESEAINAQLNISLKAIQNQSLLHSEKSVESSVYQWQLRCSPKFVSLWPDLAPETQRVTSIRLNLLDKKRVNLGNPYSSKIKGANCSHLRELRIRKGKEQWRLLYAFDPDQFPVLLLVGRKDNGNHWYDQNVPIADAEYEQHLWHLEQQQWDKIISFDQLWLQMPETLREQAKQNFMAGENQ